MIPLLIFAGLFGIGAIVFCVYDLIISLRLADKWWKQFEAGEISADEYVDKIKELM